jgi:hypothetical protein
MITWHYDLRLWQRVKERACCFELLRPRPLREIARNGYNVRPRAPERFDQRLDRLFVHAAEVNI